MGASGTTHYTNMTELFVFQSSYEACSIKIFISDDLKSLAEFVGVVVLIVFDRLANMQNSWL